MTPASKRRLVGIGAIIVAGCALSFVAFGEMGENLVYFWTPEELLAKGSEAHGQTVRLGGMVENGSYQWDGEKLDLKFRVGMQPEPGAAAVAVKAVGAPPQMFREGIGVVVEGIYDGQIFQADRVLVKHSNEYTPPATGEKPADLYPTVMSEAEAPH